MTETLSPTQRARAKAAASFAAVNAAGLAMDQLAAEARARTGRTPPRWQQREQPCSAQEQRVRGLLAAAA